MIYVLNVDESACAEASADRDKILKDSDYIATSAKIESELAELPPEEAKEYLKELKLDASGLDRLIKIAYETLNLITFLTSGPTESRAWTVEKGAKAPQAAGVIHTDIVKAFIRAEVINWKTLLEAGGLVQARSKGLIKTVGRDYIIQEGDVVEILIGK